MKNRYDMSKTARVKHKPNNKRQDRRHQPRGWKGPDKNKKGEMNYV